MSNKRLYLGFLFVLAAIYVLYVIILNDAGDEPGDFTILDTTLIVLFGLTLCFIFITQLIQFWLEEVKNTQRRYLIGFMFCAILSSMFLPKALFQSYKRSISQLYLAPWDLKVEDMQILSINSDGRFSYRNLFWGQPIATGTWPKDSDTIYFEHCKLYNDRDDFFTYAKYKKDKTGHSLVAYQNNTDTIGTVFQWIGYYTFVN
jgi:hypothetical protein